MLGTQSFKCKVVQPFNYKKSYEVGDIFEVRTYSPIEKGYLNIGFVEKFPEEDYIYKIINNTGLDVETGKTFEYDEIKELISDVDMFVRLGYIDQILKTDLKEEKEVVKPKDNALPYGCKPCKAHQELGMKFNEFIKVLHKCIGKDLPLNQPMSDEIIDKINEYLGR